MTESVINQVFKKKGLKSAEKSKNQKDIGMHFRNENEKVRKILKRWLTNSRKRIFTPKFHVRLCFSVVFHLDSHILKTLSYIYGYSFLCFKVTSTFVSPKYILTENDTKRLKYILRYCDFSDFVLRKSTYFKSSS